MVATKKDKISGQSLGTGRRKTAVARVRLKAGTGDQATVLDALESTNHRADVDIHVRVHGGGPTGQAGAIKMGIARALCDYDAATFAHLRGNGFLTRDSRMKERKKYGLRGARRGVQFSKR